MITSRLSQHLPPKLSANTPWLGVTVAHSSYQAAVLLALEVIK